ncbi:MAG TPA: TIM barrel protein [Candidatus Deferrimicrobium sp.]|nr:TIM barrel protein [Candidatus Deferrimicrobium sp.]
MIIPLERNKTNLRVGPAAVPTTSIKSFYEMIDQCQTRQFTALELEFVRITSIEYPTPAIMKELAIYANERNVSLSIHGSLYINLAAIEDSKIELTKEHIRQGFRAATDASANLIFHAGYFQNLLHYEAIKKAVTLLNSLNLPDTSKVFLETPGKLNSIGDISELLKIAAQTGVQIAIDWGHFFARKVGKDLRTAQDVRRLLSTIEDAINQTYFHMHISGIEYTKKGEKQHLAFSNSDFPLEVVIEGLKEVGYSGTLICESPNRWKEDTELLMQLLRGEKVEFSRKKRITLFDYLKDPKK